MKHFSKILLAAMAALPLVSCVKDEIKRGEPENDSYGVYFETLTDEQKVSEFDPSDPAELEFKAFRTKENDDITVPLEITVKGGKGEEDPSTYFVATELFFEEGATEATFKVVFPEAPLGQTFKVEVACRDYKYIKIYSPKPTSFSFETTRVKWNLVTGKNGETTGTWTDDLFSSMFGLNNPYFTNKIEIYEREDKPGYYRIMDVYNADMIGGFFGLPGSAVPPEQVTPGTYTFIDATDPNKVWLPLQNSGASLGGDGILLFGSLCSQNGFSKNAYGVMKDGVIAFPKGGIVASFTGAAHQGKWYTSNKEGKTIIKLPGYTK